MKNRLWILLIALLSGGCSNDSGDAVVISAASSLTYALEDLVGAYRQANPSAPLLRLNFGATGVLAQQIRQGAPVDLFVAADSREFDSLRLEQYLTDDEIRFEGRLVIWCRQNAACPENLGQLDQPEIRRIAIAHPEIAPYGQAAVTALQTLGSHDRLVPRLIQGQTARAALRYAETGDADVALTAQSLAQSVGGRWTAVDDALYPPIEQGIAVVKPSSQPAQHFFDFVGSPTGRQILDHHGFHGVR